MRKKKTQEEFLQEVINVHGETLILDKCTYRGFLKKVTVGCKIHGYFDIRADHLLDGCACHKCAKEAADDKRRLTKEEYVKRCAQIHDNFYNYDKCKLKGLGNDVIITCPIHGDFKQRASNHLNGTGCPWCSREKIKEIRRLSFGEFEKRANEIHNFKYNYIEETYKKANSKLKIICQEHGIFEQQASAHLLGQGCPKCGYENISKKRSKGLDNFIEEATKLHNNMYDYSKVVYKNNYTPVIITCPKHGEFFQTPHNHLSGCSCPNCSNSKLEETLRTLLEEKNVKYIYQASNNVLPWIGNQRIDFYLPDYNIAIECQGKQHFFPVDFAGKGEEWAKNKFQHTLQLDELKRNKCKENNVKLEYINYNEDIKKRILEIIS